MKYQPIQIPNNSNFNSRIWIWINHQFQFRNWTLPMSAHQCSIRLISGEPASRSMSFHYRKFKDKSSSWVRIVLHENEPPSPIEAASSHKMGSSTPSRLHNPAIPRNYMSMWLAKWIWAHTITEPPPNPWSTLTIWHAVNCSPWHLHTLIQQSMWDTSENSIVVSIQQSANSDILCWSPTWFYENVLSR